MKSPPISEAKAFWKFMKDNETFLPTRSELRQFYKNTYLPTLKNETKHASFCSIMWCFRVKLNIIKWEEIEERENITYLSDPNVNIPKESKKEKRRVANDLADLKKKVAETKRGKLSKHKSGIVITPPPNKKGKIDVDVQTKLLHLTVTNTNNRPVRLRCVHLGCTKSFSVDDKVYKIVSGNKLAELTPGGKITFDVELLANNIGIYVTPVAFMFRFGDQDEPFHIVKYVQAEISDEIVEEIQPKAKYVKQEPVVEILDRDVERIPGEPPDMGSTDYKRKLLSYGIPSPLRYAMGTRRLKGQADKLCGGQVTADGYKNKFSTLLHIEELQMEVDIKRYSMHDGQLQKDCSYLTLEVPGLSENRPSLLKGDRLFVRKLDVEGEPEKKQYEGFIHEVSLNKVHLKFSRQFHTGFVKGARYKVDFTFSRTCLKLMHRAVEMAKEFIESIPVYGQAQGELVNNGPISRFYDRKIESNEEQQQAIRNIINGTSKPYPYIVFGPPGTGKTVTIVETIKQVLKMNPNSCILACAPSNSAADLILKRVTNHNVVPESKMLRLNAFSRATSSVDKAILKFCKKNRDGNFYFPKIEDIQNNYRLVVTTLLSAGRLFSMGMEKGHFSHIFIDEAGQATEPECLVPITTLLGPEGQLVLAGDPKQLGPVLTSPIAIEFGLGISFLERLMESQFSCFRNHVDGYDNAVVTKLLNNYRSHPAIIELPNEMFYDDELQYCADEMQRNSMCSWKCLRNGDFPVLFQPVFGEDTREEKSPSFFNPQEVSMVLNLVKELVEARGLALKNHEIGIITPYHKQVKKIQEILQKNKIRDIKVGSVEQFQGDEKKVIIISTVRTSKKFLNYDAEFHLGFLKNPKRFNVAITRAKALLIVVGNPNVLAHDEHWRSFIQYCMDNDSFGAKPSGYIKKAQKTFTMPDICDQEITSQFEKLMITDQTLRSAVNNVSDQDDEDDGDDVPEWTLPQE